MARPTAPAPTTTASRSNAEFATRFSRLYPVSVKSRAAAALDPQRDRSMPWEIRKGHGGRARSLAKAVSWRIVGTIDTFVWSLLITKQAVAAGSIASAEVFTKIVVFYLHERVWRLILWAPNAHLRSDRK